MLTEQRERRFREVAARRQRDLTVVLENVHDPHNIGAVMRTCDAVGIGEIFIIYTEEGLKARGIGKSSSSGTKKWVKVNYFENIGECLEDVKKKYKNIFATHLGEKSVDMHDLKLAEPMALLFGNEHDGVSQEALSLCDGNFIIPQFGMVQSLNISVACAVTLYEALRQRKLTGKYDCSFDANDEFQKALYDEYMEKQIKR